MSITNGGETKISGVGTVSKHKCNLKDILKQQGRKQKWLCNEVGLDQTWMTKIVKGDGLPNVHDAQRIADSLGVSIAEIWPVPPKKEE